MRSSQDLTHTKTRRAITKAAAVLFVRHGYDATSIDLIATQAKVARQTIYNQFESKEALFRAVISDIADEATMALSAPVRQRATTRTTLLHLARSILSKALRPSTLALHRLVVAETARFPELGEAIYDAGAGRSVAQLGDFLRHQNVLGNLEVPHPKVAAEQFFAMVTSFQHFRALIGLKPTPDHIEASARGAVATFQQAFEMKRPVISSGNAPRFLSRQPSRRRARLH
jgi:AcrR family transcriptional regulator